MINKHKISTTVRNYSEQVSRSVLSLLLFILIFSSCKKNITIDLPPSVQQFIVEGHIETGQPPYIILTRSSDYYSVFYLDSINKFFVHNAIVKISDGTDTFQLPELSIDTGNISVSAYVGLGISGEEGKTYSLSIQAEGKTLTSVTTIPYSKPLDSIWYETGVIPGNDTFVRLVCRYTDAPQSGQYVRYFTKENSNPFYPGLNSVFEDAVINGTTFDFPLDKGVSRTDTTTFYPGYFQFRKGDTITVKWCQIDKPHFDFWRTLEFELGGQESPFASPIDIQSNINGGLGIWGGYAPSYKTIMVPK
ncbi:MAG: DUF4249 domain-containing protein [Chitinophagales bacterium]|nr:DUF4249 domain-containing protein [Chitinophagales bacterium]